jgi:site-specific recombinase XerD
MKGLIRKGKKFAFQAGIPKDVRVHFDGKKKHNVTFHTDDPIIAEKLAVEADREFRSTILQYRQAALSGDRLDPIRREQIVGWLFGNYFNRLDGVRDFDMQESVHAIITEANEDDFPLTRGLRCEGLVFDGIVESVERLLEWAEGTGYARKRTPDRPGSTLIGACDLWAIKAKHIPKTISQYKKSIRDFTKWFELSHGQCYGAAITMTHVNEYVGYLMRKDAARATIARELAALRLVYKFGQFSRGGNPFAGVADRMIIEGDKLKVRDFTDSEMTSLLKPGYDDWPAVMIAAYSGMRLSEITSLKAKNVERAGKGYVFNLINAGRRKTAAAYRKVPVHPVLLQKVIRGLLKGLDSEAPLLGPDTTDSLSKRINRVIDTVTTDPSVRAHSLRHTFISRLANIGVRKELRMAIAGHEGSDAHDRYSHADFLVELAQQIGKLRY